MPAQAFSDDTIRIRVDAAAAVREFLGLLAEQAAAGETRAPAKPANRAVFRELAPYRLVEYSYVDDGIGVIEGVFLGFPDGALYSVSDDIPEEAVDALVAGDLANVPPVYVHVVLAEAQSAERIDHFLGQLAYHMGKGLVALLPGGARAYEGGDGCLAILTAGLEKCAAEANSLPGKAELLARFAARSQSADGRAYAQISYDFAKHVLEFPSAADRDDFLVWSQILCNAEEFSFAGVLRPAEPAPPPPPSGETIAVPLIAPARYDNGVASPAQALGYWTYVTTTVAAGRG